MKRDYYMYPAIFDYSDDGISISFPDLPGCFSCADSDQEAMHMAKDAMGLHLFGMEKDNNDIPEPTQLNKIHIETNQKVVLIEVHMPIIREAIENYSVKKTLSVPQWLNRIAEQNNINFSQVLQAALKERLGLERK